MSQYKCYSCCTVSLVTLFHCYTYPLWTVTPQQLQHCNSCNSVTVGKS